jgi:pyrroline-5-carboxylate reductase
MFIEALSDGGVECGLPRDKALKYAEQTVLGAAKTALAYGQNPAALKDAVCSPGGTTIAGVHALENGAFRATVMNCVNAAYEKTLKIGK